MVKKKLFYRLTKNFKMYKYFSSNSVVSITLLAPGEGIGYFNAMDFPRYSIMAHPRFFQYLITT